MRFATTLFALMLFNACNHSSAPTASEGPADTTNNTFNHENVQTSDLDIDARNDIEGDPVVAVQLHSCQQVKYASLSNLLASRGVNMASTTAGSAAVLYKNGASALGAPDYVARTAEGILPSAAGATKLMDIFVAAAPEIIANIGKAAAAQVAGQPVAIFDSTGACTADGLTALMGFPATAQHVAICNQIVSSSTTTQVGQKVAVAAFLSSANFCE